MQKLLIVGVIALVLGGGGGFYGGMKYEQSKLPAGGNFAGMRQQFGAAGGGSGTLTRRNGNANGGFTAGQIISRDDKSVTVKIAGGGSKIIFYSGSTSIGKTAAGTAADLAVGQDVVATGTANSDGSITASNIQIRPAGQTPPAPTTPTGQ